MSEVLLHKSPSDRLVEIFRSIGKFNCSSSDNYEFTKEEVGVTTTFRTHAGNYKKIEEQFGDRSSLCDFIKTLIEENDLNGVVYESDGRRPSFMQRTVLPISQGEGDDKEVFMKFRIERHIQHPADGGAEWVEITLD